MPVATNLEQRFSSLSTADCLTKEDIVAPHAVSPSKSECGHSVYSANSDDDASHDGMTMLARKTEHKLMEEKGMLSDEPLLQENPYRFVLFPIQDNDVSHHRRYWTKLAANIFLTLFFLLSFGKCTRKPKLPSGHPKKLILVAI
jgi:hypothetical protein